MRHVRTLWWTAMVMLLVASQALAQGNPTGGISGQVVDPDGLALPGVDGDRRRRRCCRARARRRLRATATTSSRSCRRATTRSRSSCSGFQTLKQTVRVEIGATIPLNGQDGARGGHRDRDGDRRRRPRSRRPRRSRAPTRPDIIERLPMGRTLTAYTLLAPGRERQRAERQHHGVGRALVREPEPGQRRRGQREPARPGAEPVHRGRHPGDEGLDRQHLRRVRPVPGRRRQHDHQVGRQHLQRVVPHVVHQRRRGRRSRRIPGDANIDKIVPTYEFTFGGPVLRDRLWFFGAGRLENRKVNVTTPLHRPTTTSAGPTRSATRAS